MKLEDYLDKYIISPVSFAEECKISKSSVYSYINGNKPHKRTALKIQKHTNGEVTVKDLLGD